MQQRARKVFYGKVLLFGEHIIHLGGRGLAVPAPVFHGRFRFAKDQTAAQSLSTWADWITSQPELAKGIDTASFFADIQRGMYFDSNIPQGYGAGSSGALTAAVYHSYRKNKSRISTEEIKDQLSRLESFFHGKSSGLDPLVSFLNYPISISENEIRKVALPQGKDHTAVFLLDTQMARSTGDWVKLFLQKCRQPDFKRMISESMIPVNENCIQTLLTNKQNALFNSLQLLSQLQFDYMREFIPEHLHNLWHQSLMRKEYKLKICGAGGGGFMLCFTSLTQQELEFKLQHPLIRIL
jgi:mevalonate kinase